MRIYFVSWRPHTTCNICVIKLKRRNMTSYAVIRSNKFNRMQAILFQIILTKKKRAWHKQPRWIISINAIQRTHRKTKNTENTCFLYLLLSKWPSITDSYPCILKYKWIQRSTPKHHIIYLSVLRSLYKIYCQEITNERQKKTPNPNQCSLTHIHWITISYKIWLYFFCSVR